MIRDMILVDAVVHPYDLVPQPRTVAEPCSFAKGLPLDICEMSPIDEIEIQDGHIRITLMALEGVRSVDVRQTLDDLWTPDRVGRAP